MSRLKVSREARSDIAAIRKYSLDRFGPVVADEYLRGLADRLAALIETPQLGTAYADRRDGKLRVTTYRSHRIFHEFDYDVVRVVRVLHQAMDVDRWLD